MVPPQECLPNGTVRRVAALIKLSENPQVSRCQTVRNRLHTAKVFPQTHLQPTAPTVAPLENTAAAECSLFSLIQTATGDDGRDQSAKDCRLTKGRKD